MLTPRYMMALGQFWAQASVIATVAISSAFWTEYFSVIGRGMESVTAVIEPVGVGAMLTGCEVVNLPYGVAA